MLSIPQFIILIKLVNMGDRLPIMNFLSNLVQNLHYSSVIFREKIELDRIFFRIMLRPKHQSGPGWRVQISWRRNAVQKAEWKLRGVSCRGNQSGPVSEAAAMDSVDSFNRGYNSHNVITNYVWWQCWHDYNIIMIYLEHNTPTFTMQGATDMISDTG